MIPNRSSDHPHLRWSGHLPRMRRRGAAFVDQKGRLKVAPFRAESRVCLARLDAAGMFLVAPCCLCPSLSWLRLRCGKMLIYHRLELLYIMYIYICDMYVCLCIYSLPFKVQDKIIQPVHAVKTCRSSSQDGQNTPRRRAPVGSHAGSSSTAMVALDLSHSLTVLEKNTL